MVSVELLVFILIVIVICALLRTLIGGEPIVWIVLAVLIILFYTGVDFGHYRNR